jgi:H+-translocating NAD(P) transhydrogenase subunit beta
VKNESVLTRSFSILFTQSNTNFLPHRHGILHRWNQTFGFSRNRAVRKSTGITRYAYWGCRYTFDREIIAFEFIIAGVVIGAFIGIFAAKKVQMTAMPEMVAIFNGFGGGASALVAWGEFTRLDPSIFDTQGLITTGLSILIGSITFTGSFIAFGKLKGFIGGGRIALPGQNYINLLLTAIALGLVGWFAVDPEYQLVFWLLFGLALLIGVLTVLPIGGADMPVVISLLNSYSGIAASMAGFVLGNNLLIISGALVGAAGLILTNIMCKAMNRTLINVLFGAFGGVSDAGDSDDGDKSYQQTFADDVAIQCAYASKVVITPGYGLAVAQAQHTLKEVANILEERGVTVKYGIHPVAGRMPGHMNVLLARLTFLTISCMTWMRSIRNSNQRM